MLAPLALALTALAGPVAPHPQGAPAPRGNVLLLVADDLGVDMLASYGLGNDLPATPTLDQLAAGGVRFETVWSNPVCSPTRATLQTGRYGFRTGVGDIVGGIGSVIGLPAGELTLPEALDLGLSGYAHAAIGKWHLCNQAVDDPCAPFEAGYTYFEGIDRNPTPNYFNWTKIVNGVELPGHTVYATTDQVDSALGWIQQAPEPWFCVVNFNAPHSPYHDPPAHLHGQNLNGVSGFTRRRRRYKAMVEAMDTEIGRLLAGLGGAAGRTTTLFVGDNGTPQEVTVPPFIPSHAKRTLYEGGVAVPLIVHGATVTSPGSVNTNLINTTDLFATILDIAGVDPRAVLPHGRVLDAVSFLPQFYDPPPAQVRRLERRRRFEPPRPWLEDRPGPLEPAARVRRWLFAERFLDQNGCDPIQARRAVRTARYKLHRNPNGDLFYDLQKDPFEQHNLLQNGLDELQQMRFDQLSATLEGLLSRPDCLP